MIVIAKKVGRLANGLTLFAHFIGAAIEHGFTVANPAFWNFAHYFPATAHDPLCRFPPGPRVLSSYTVRRSLYRAVYIAAGGLHLLQRTGRDFGLIRLRRDQHLDLDSPAFLQAARRRRLLFVQDWNFRGFANFQRHREAICAFFTPWQRHLDNAQAAVQPARAAGRFLVGLHVRRGDYAAFKGGRFFYTYEQYRDVMTKVCAAFPDREVAFLVCSDEATPPGAFAGHNVLHGSGHPLEDLYALAACDRLAGPPSTYSAWASYYGNVPRYSIYDPAQAVTADAFRLDPRVALQPAEAAAQAGAAPALQRDAPG